MTIKVKQMLVSESKYSIKCPNAMSAEYITFHNTANDASAENEIKYMIGNNNEVSYHFAVDDKEVIQGVPTNRNAWHCGDGGSGTGNRKSIGVEVCYSKSGGEKYKKAEALAIKFIAQLLHERGWGVDKVKPHKHWSGKNCPHRILDEGRWDAVVKSIQKELDSLKGVKSTSTAKATNGTHVVVKGDTLWGIAEKYGTTVEKLKELNKGINESALQIGSKLAVSGTVKAESKTSSASTSKPATSHKHEYKKLGRAKGDVWSHSKADFESSTRKVVINQNASLQVCCEQNGLYYTDKGWVSTKYVDIVGDAKKVDLPHVTLRRGSSGNNVVQVQRALNELKFNCGTADGVYGAKTEDAVKRFQMVNDPKNVDGIYGSRTEERMEALLNK